MFSYLRSKRNHRRSRARVLKELQELGEILGNVQLKEKNQHQRDCLVIGIALLVMVIIFVAGLSEVVAR
jgi:hypothetical protein